MYSKLYRVVYLTQEFRQIRFPKCTFSRPDTMSHCLVVDIERQVFFVVRGIQRPIRRGPATVAKSVRVPRQQGHSIHYAVNTYHIKMMMMHLKIQHCIQNTPILCRADEKLFQLTLFQQSWPNMSSYLWLAAVLAECILKPDSVVLQKQRQFHHREGRQSRKATGCYWRDVQTGTNRHH